MTIDVELLQMVQSLKEDVLNASEELEWVYKSSEQIERVLMDRIDAAAHGHLAVANDPLPVKNRRPGSWHYSRSE